MSKTIRFGMIGAGQIAHWSAQCINQHDNGQVVAAQDPSGQRLEELCLKHNIPKRYETAAELLADPEVDAVYIAVPNKFHAPLALQALEAGKHVVLEKPFAFNYAEALAVVEAATRNNRVFTLGMNQRFGAGPQTVRSMVRSGELGEVYHAKAFWFRRAGIPKLGTWFGKKELAGGGCLYDIGVHMLDVCLFAMDNFEPVSVTGATYCKFGNRGLGEGSWGMSESEHNEFDVEDFATGLIRFANGATVSLDVSWACHAGSENRNDVQLYGTEAGASCFPATVFRSGTERGEYLTVTNPKPRKDYATDRFHNFINHLNGTEELCVKPSEALIVQRILDGIAESCATGREVRL